MDLWKICKRDIDYQKTHPKSYRYPESEKTAIRRSGKYNEWRKAVFERDDYTCQSCGQHGGILNAHHIKPFSQYPNDRLDINNGITLCKECHRLLHRGELVIDWR
jgi:5-methylcytosine-specific restriction endonuclease McrA